MEDNTQEQADAAADMSVRSARKWAHSPMPTESRRARNWRTRKDPLGGIWEEKIVPWLEADKEGVLQATSVVLALLAPMLAVHGENWSAPSKGALFPLHAAILRA